MMVQWCVAGSIPADVCTLRPKQHWLCTSTGSMGCFNLFNACPIVLLSELISDIFDNKI